MFNAQSRWPLKLKETIYVQNIFQNSSVDKTKASWIELEDVGFLLKNNL